MTHVVFISQKIPGVRNAFVCSICSLSGGMKASLGMIPQTVSCNYVNARW